MVRVTALPRAASSWPLLSTRSKPAVAARSSALIAARTKQALPAKLRIDGVDKPLRCEAHVDEQMVRLTATLPFLRLDGGVDVVLGEQGGVAAAGDHPQDRGRSGDHSDGDPAAGAGRRARRRAAHADRALRQRARANPVPSTPAHEPAAAVRTAALGGGRGRADPRRAGVEAGRRGGACTAPPRLRRPSWRPGPAPGDAWRRRLRRGRRDRAADHWDGLVVARRWARPGSWRRCALAASATGPARSAPDCGHVRGANGPTRGDQLPAVRSLLAPARPGRRRRGSDRLGFWPTLGIAWLEIVAHFQNLPPCSPIRRRTRWQLR